jgi:exodeoxyribonuclease V alpha subunit
MNPTTEHVFDGRIRVGSIRSKNPHGFGGCIFSGFEVDARGEIVDAKTIVVVKTPGYLLPSVDAVERGETWHVTGSASLHTRTCANFLVTEVEVGAKALHKIRETGELIIYALANNPAFERIGTVTARKIWNAFGEELYAILDAGDATPLAPILGANVAAGLVEAWAKHVSSQTYSFLQSCKIPMRLAQRIVEFYGNDAQKAVTEDGYRLLSFSASWKVVDALATTRLGVGLEDPRRMHAAVEEGLYRLLDRHGHTAVPVQLVIDQLRLLLGGENAAQETNRLVRKCLADTKGNGAYIVENGLYWSAGAYAMEECVAEAIAEMIMVGDRAPNLFMSMLTDGKLNELIDAYETQERAKAGTSFKLTERQRQAVVNCARHRFTVVTGGAGTGKTTVLKCLYYIVTAAGYGISQMALSGRAAKRMQEATGLPAQTIAGYLNSTHQYGGQDESHYLVIDEASMLDLATTYRILWSMPEDARVVLVGDPYQLPPIMPGLIFHILTDLPGIPLVELVEVKRQEDETGIPAAANSVRYGAVPIFGVEGSGKGAIFIPCADEAIHAKTLELFLLAPERTQILSATKKCLRSGARPLSAACCEALTAENREILVPSNLPGAYAKSGFREGDRIMFLKNDWGRGVNNGSIGHISEIVDVPVMNKDGETTLALADFDGTVVPIYESDLTADKPVIEHGYAVTVHKAQGSQWPRVVIPIRHSRILDRTLVYTAMTRAEEEVVLIGDIAALKEAVESPPAAHVRQVGFGHLMRRKLYDRGFRSGRT